MSANSGILSGHRPMPSIRQQVAWPDANQRAGGPEHPAVRQTTRPITLRGGDGISADPDVATTRHERQPMQRRA
jgi:hypothetical protein